MRIWKAQTAHLALSMGLPVSRMASHLPWRVMGAALPPMNRLQTRMPRTHTHHCARYSLKPKECNCLRLYPRSEASPGFCLRRHRQVVYLSFAQVDSSFSKQLHWPKCLCTVSFPAGKRPRTSQGLRQFTQRSSDTGPVPIPWREDMDKGEASF